MRTKRIENTDYRIFVIYTSGQVSRSKQRFRRTLEYVGPLGRAANLTLSVHDLGGEVSGVEVGHEASYLAALYLEDAHPSVGDTVAVGGALGGPLQRRPLLCGENVSERGLHLIEGLAVLCPELAQSLVASEGLRDRDVAHLAVLGMDPDQAFYVSVFLQLPQRLDETVRHLLRHTLGPFSCGHGLQGNVASSTEAASLLLQRVVPPIHERVAPLGVFRVFLGSLPEVALDVAVDLFHVLYVVVCVVGFVLALNSDDPAPRLVALGLATAVTLSDRLGLLSLEPLFELLWSHVHGL